MSPLVYRAADRFRTTTDGVSTWHAFSFGPHYDPSRLGVGALSALNDEHVAPGAGYDDHRHVDVELVTLVLYGVLVHTDSHGDLGAPGRRTELGPGSLVRTSAGSGITHAERNDPGSGPLRFLQAWVRPDEPGATPSLSQAQVGTTERGVFVPLVAGPASPRRDDALLGVGSATATLWHAELGVGDDVELPDAAHTFLTVLGGEVAIEGPEGLSEGLDQLDGWSLTAGDSLTGGGGRRVRAHGEEAPVLLLWTFDGPAAVTPG